MTSSSPSNQTSNISKGTIQAESKPATFDMQTDQKPSAPRSLEQWQTDAYFRILGVTLDANNTVKGGQKLLYLSGLAEELRDEGEKEPFLVTAHNLDRLLVARLTMESADPSMASSYPAAMLNATVFDYLLTCWRKASDVRKNLISRGKGDPTATNERVHAVDALRSLLVSYAGLILQMPDMFPQLETDPVTQKPRAIGSDQLASRLLNDPDLPEGLPDEFTLELISRFTGDGLESIFGPPLQAIADRMKQETIITDFRTPLRALTRLVEIKPFAAMLHTLPNWDPTPPPPVRVNPMQTQPPAEAPQLEVISLLGPFFRISAFPDDVPQVAETFFSHPDQRSRSDIESAVASIRGTVGQLNTTYLAIFNSIVRASPEARQGVLNYMAHFARANDKRAQMQVDRALISGDGIMWGLAEAGRGLCEPFIDVRGSKIDKIDTNYFRSTDRLNFKADTKINATQEESDAYYGSVTRTEGSAAKPASFITEIFYLTLTLMHLGPIRSYVNHNEFVRRLKEVLGQVNRIREDQSRWAGTPQGPLNELILKRASDSLSKMQAHKLAYDAHLLDPITLSNHMRFYNFVMSWVIRLADPKHNHPWTTVQLPLPDEIPEVFRMLPEWVMEDVLEFFIFVGRFGYEAHVLASNSTDELVTFIVTFLRSSKYIKNPYLKAKLVEILFFFTFPMYQGVPGDLDATLNSNPVALEHLVPAIMAFYVDVEQTGVSSQFYDKFNIRYNISQVMKTIWNHPTHRAKLREESQNTDRFTRFVNMLMSDVTYLLDESLSKLADIHRIQVEMGNAATWEAKTPQQRQEIEGNLRSLERQATSYVALGNETVHMLKYMTAEVVDPFMSPEIVDRLAAMLDYNLAQLVGPKCTELKVSKPEKYHFQPRVLLSELIDIYLNLSERKEFVLAVSRDGRSYNKAYFSKAANIMLRFSLKGQDEVVSLGRFVDRVEEAVKSGAEEEEELGDVPDEFLGNLTFPLDPIFFTLMEDPVLLPTSHTIVDRSTIRAHLLGDTRDPFNRAPLTMEMVVPDDALKQRIQDWRSAARQK